MEPLSAEYVVAHPLDPISLDLYQLTRHWKLTPPLLVVEPGWWRIKTTDHGHVDLAKMLTNWRLLLNGDGLWEHGLQGYCFNGPRGHVGAITAGIEWSGLGDPAGRWYRSIRTDARRKEYLHG